MMTGAHPRLLVAEGVAITITIDVEGEVETIAAVVVEDFVEEAEGEEPLVIITMTTIIIEVGEMEEEGEIATGTIINLSEEEEEGAEEGGVAEIITTTTTITTDHRDRAREVDSEWDVGGEEGEARTSVGVVVDGLTKEGEGDTITVETTVAQVAEEGGEE
jgi:hypothetical protein